jgi:hypothetical protein
VAVRGLPVTDPEGSNFNWGGYIAAFGSMPQRFLPTDRGTVIFAGVDWVTYDGLPNDGLNALHRDGNIARGTLPPPEGKCPMPWKECLPEYLLTWHIDVETRAVEYYSAAIDHYFVTASAADIDALDSGRSPGWERTHNTFGVVGSPLAYPPMTQPVCRFYIPLGNLHFLSASRDECQQIRQFVRA